jgi:hypothetical protein
MESLLLVPALVPNKTLNEAEADRTIRSHQSNEPNKKGPSAQLKEKSMNSILFRFRGSPISTAAHSFRKCRLGLAALLACLVTLGAALPSHARSGKVLSPRAQPRGYSLDEMASAVANFSITGNDPAFYPDTPFQIIYRGQGGTFTVAPGTFLYVKFFFVDDAEPTLGDLPTDKNDVADYVFGASQLGGHDLEIEVDGKVTSLDDPGYIGGPVPTPNSPDGSEYLIQIGAFVSPLKKGTHTLTIRGIFDGDAVIEAIGGPIEFEATYTIIVE